MRSNFPLVGAVFVLFGLIFGGVGGALLRSEASKGDGFMAAQGTVTELEWSANDARPVVTFTTDKGEQRTVRGSVWSHPPQQQLGDHLAVRYGQKAGSDFIDDPVERWLLPSIFTGFGLTFFLIGAGVVALRRKPVSPEEEERQQREFFARVARGPRADDFNVFRLVGLIFTPIGLAALVGFGLWVRSELKDREGFVAARGTVVDFKTDGRGYAAAIVEYRDADGQAHRLTSNVWSRPPAYDKGDEVKVQYRVSKPDDAFVDGFLVVWVWPMVMLVFALVFGGLGGLLLYFSRDDAQRESAA